MECSEYAGAVSMQDHGPQNNPLDGSVGKHTQLLEMLRCMVQAWAKVCLVLFQQHRQLKASTGDMLQHELRVAWVHLHQGTLTGRHCYRITCIALKARASFSVLQHTPSSRSGRTAQPKAYPCTS